MFKNMLHKRVVALTIIVTFSSLMIGCGASENCCDCVKYNSCIKWDKGACNSDDSCSNFNEDNDYGDDNDTLDGIVSLMWLMCLIFNQREMAVNYSCAKENNCVSKCADDSDYIEYYESKKHEDYTSYPWD